MPVEFPTYCRSHDNCFALVLAPLGGTYSDGVASFLANPLSFRPFVPKFRVIPIGTKRAPT